ncbi:hypothetical protein [Amycolatopsis sp. YIM 10]|uniref:hypothetical protein n=1 Tax=Amycolatopsis sp. YIM 10 TaxID=2653857 RepID=UPI001290870B|nr:hypothetical protein [Amycolatopsis sp. YIM 10]QFU89697.1 hypothetical protein YIM_22595 [Amycolatopsis sp. YIM 10]
MTEFEERQRPSPVPPALAAGFALMLGLLGLLAAVGWLAPDDARLTTFGVALRIFLAVDGGCCVIGAVLLILRLPLGRILTAVGGGAALALPVPMLPAIVVAPMDSALGVRAAGGLLAMLVVVLLGLLTMVQSVRQDTARAVAQGPK